MQNTISPPDNFCNQFLIRKQFLISTSTTVQEMYSNFVKNSRVIVNEFHVSNQIIMFG